METQWLDRGKVKGLEAVMRGGEGPECAWFHCSWMNNCARGNVVHPDGGGLVEDSVGGVQDAAVA